MTAARRQPGVLMRRHRGARGRQFNAVSNAHGCPVGYRDNTTFGTPWQAPHSPGHCFQKLSPARGGRR